MSNKIQTTNSKYDLKERTAKFGTDVLFLLKELKEDSITKPLIVQLVRSSTSIGANYMEADGAESAKDFIHKIAICKKESKESKYWLNTLALMDTSFNDDFNMLEREAHELTLIFSSILIKKRSRN